MAAAAHHLLKLLHDLDGADRINGGLGTAGKERLGLGNPVFLVRVDYVAVGCVGKFFQAIRVAAHQEHLGAAPGQRLRAPLADQAIADNDGTVADFYFGTRAGVVAYLREHEPRKSQRIDAIGQLPNAVTAADRG